MITPTLQAIGMIVSLTQAATQALAMANEVAHIIAKAEAEGRKVSQEELDAMRAKAEGKLAQLSP